MPIVDKTNKDISTKTSENSFVLFVSEKEFDSSETS